MSVAAHHVAWMLAALALGHAGFRLASAAAPRGLERVLAAAVLAVAAAVGEALALGLVGLGGNTTVLVAAALATWAAALILLPAPATTLAADARAWWSGIEPSMQLAVAALAGLFLAWVAWQLRHPAIGYDSSLYHYPDVAGWIANGRPSSALRLSYDIPYGDYPMTDEVALTWGAAIARSWIPLSLWEPALFVLMGCAAWVTFRELSLSRLPVALATVVLVTTPLVIRQLNEPETDLPAMCWLVCATALALAARRRPKLLAASLVAAGLAIGTKTSTAPLAIIVIATSAYLIRTHLRSAIGWLIGAFAAAVVVGGAWYIRDLLRHGSPLWPFVAAPWGDPKPRYFALVDGTFLRHPLGTLRGRAGAYTSRLGGSWLLILTSPAILGCGLLARTWPHRLRSKLVLIGLVALISTLAWSVAWGTGVPSTPGLPGAGGWPVSSMRYLLPAAGAALAGVAVLASAPRPLGASAVALLIFALAWNLVAVSRLGFPYTPSARVVAAGLLAGMAGLGAIRLIARSRFGGLPRLPTWAGLAAGTVVVGVVLSVASNGFISRYADVAQSTAPGQEVARWLNRQPSYTHSHVPVAILSRAVLGTLAGDHFTHRLILVPEAARCNAVTDLTKRLPVVVTDPTFFYGILGFAPYGGARCLTHLRPVFSSRSYRIYWTIPY